MRPVIVGLLVLLVSFATSQTCQALRPQSAGSIAGRVSLGGKPVRGASVMLARKEITGRSDATLPGATSDADGRFRLEPVQAGTYLVRAYAPGFVGPSDEPFAVEWGKAVTVGEGEAVQVDLGLKRGGVITGRVVDSRGRPIVNTTVDLIQLDDTGRSHPRSTPISDGSMYLTDDRGVYRIYGLASGRYKVSVGTAPGSSVIRFPGGYYPRTFHPDARDETSAAIVEIVEAGEADSVDITVSSFARTFSVSGRIVDAETGKGIKGLVCGYGAIGADGAYNGSVGVLNVQTTSSGEFFFNGLTPGRYAVFAVNEENTESYSDPTAFEITNSDISGVEVKVRHGASISGIAVIEGTNDPAAMAAMSQLTVVVDVEPKALEPLRTAAPMIALDGAFHVGGLRAGFATISVRGPRGSGKGTVILSRIEREGIEQGLIELKEGEQVTGVRLVLHYTGGTAQ